MVCDNMDSSGDSSLDEVSILKKRISELEAELYKFKNEADAMRYYLDNAPILSMSLDIPSYKVVFLNRKMSESIGRPKNEIIGLSPYDKRFSMMLSREVVDRRVTYMNEMLRRKEKVVFEDERNGRWFRNILFPIYDEKNNLIQVGAIIQEITEYKKREEERLKDKEKYFNYLIQYSYDISTIFSIDGVIKYISPSITRILGYEQEEIIGKSIYEFIHPSDKINLEDCIKNYDIRKPLIHFRLRDKNGTWIDCEATIVDRSHDSIIKGFIANIRDITEREKAKRLLKESEEKYRFVVENSKIINAVLDKNGKFTFINDYGAQIFGFKSEEIVGKRIDEIFPGDFGKERRRNLEDIIRNKKGLNNSEFSAIIKGEERWFLSNTKPFLDENGEIESILNVAMDITEKKKSELELQRSKEFFQKIIDNASDIIFTIDNNFRITIWNIAAENITGYTRDQIVNKNIQQVDVFDYSPEFIEAVKDLFHDKPFILQEIYLKTKDGARKIIQITHSLIHDDKGRVSSAIFIGRIRRLDIETYGSLLPGHSYILQGESYRNAYELFINTMNHSEPGLLITRLHPDELDAMFPSFRPNILLLQTLKESRYPIASNLDELIESITLFVNNNPGSVILLDRVDYLISLYSFESVLKTIYRITEIIANTACVFLLRADFSTLTPQQTTFLQQEMELLPSTKIHRLTLDRLSIEILKYIEEMNHRNTQVTPKQIYTSFHLSRITAQKKIQFLEEKKLVYTRRYGRTKTIYITERGRVLLKSHFKKK